MFSCFQFYFQKLEITLRPLFWPKNPHLKKIVDLKVYSNVKAVTYNPPSVLGTFESLEFRLYLPLFIKPIK